MPILVKPALPVKNKWLLNRNLHHIAEGTTEIIHGG
jgi:hypothetical protein